MSLVRKDYYLPRLQRSSSQFFLKKEGFFAVTKNILGEGSFGFVVDAKKIISPEEAHDLVIKKVILNFLSYCRRSFPELSDEEQKNIAKKMYDRELNNIKREVFIFEMRYGFGQLYLSPDDLIARAVFFKLPGKALNKYSFSDSLDFLSIWIKIQIEAHFLHTLYGIIHGDLKLANVMYDEKTGQVYFCDFGRSYRVGEKSSGEGLEENYYLHPALMKKPYPVAAPCLDVFSLGKMIEGFDKHHSRKKETPLASTLLKDIFEGMTQLDSKEQWTLPKAIHNSILIYNKFVPSNPMSLNLEDYKPAFLPSKLHSLNIKNADEQDIPSDALFPMDLSDQFYVQQKIMK